MLQDLGSDHLPILLSVPLPPVCRPGGRPPSFNFQKACWDGFVSYLGSHCSSAEEYSFLSVSSAAVLFYISGTECSQIFHSFRPHQTPSLKPGGLLRWKKRLVKNPRLLLPLTEVMKIARLTSPLLDAPRQSSPSLRHGRRLALLSHLGLTLNLCTFFFALSLAFLPHLLTSLTVLLPGNRLRSMPLT